jgi:hypothetical protein
MRFRFACLISLFATGMAVAQNAEIPRPDTLGANFDHTAIGKGTPSDYDFLVGKWEFRYQPRDQETGKYAPVVKGSWVGTRLFDGLFSDQFINGTAGPLMTYRAFNPTEGIWKVQGVNVRRGVWQPGSSWSDAGNRYLVQENPERKTTIRVRYYSITADHFLWRADGSRDGGKTWMRDVMLIEATRIKE